MKSLPYILIPLIVGLVTGLLIGIFFASSSSTPRSKYDCLKLGSNKARIICVKLYFPKK
jgi:hypothetical protein